MAATHAKCNAPQGLKLKNMEEKSMHNLFLKNMSGLIEESRNPSVGENPWVYVHLGHALHTTLKLIVKVSKSRKQILKFSFEPKNERKYFCIPALASKSGRIKKI